MDTLSMHYFTTLARVLNFTKAAQELFISQQNLSQHIKKLEEHYKAPLLYRKPVLKLTPVGEVVYHSFLTILKEEENAFKKVSDVIETNKGKLAIGASPYKGQFWIPRVIPDFLTHWPNVETKIVMKSSLEMKQQLLLGELDFYVGLEFDNDPLLIKTSLMQDKVYIVATDELLKKYLPNLKAEEVEELEKGTYLKPFKDLPFLRLTENYKLRTRVDKCFQAEGIEPKHILEVENIDLMINHIPYNIGAFFCTGLRMPYLKEMYPNIHFFPLLFEENFLYSPLDLVHHKDTYFPVYAKDLILRLQNFFKDTSE